MRLSDAEREQILEQLKRHAAAGRLDVPELERRVEAVARAVTREQAVEQLSDLPTTAADPASPPPSRSRPRWGRGHGDADAPRPDWRATAERFRDPRTNRIMRVWEDPSGQRHYVIDDGGA